MERKFVIAGIGGQGVVYATKVLSQAALLRGETVMASENHGMSQRGGSVMAHVKVGESTAPLIRRGAADALIGFDRTEVTRNLGYVRAGGSVFVNSPTGLDAAVLKRLTELGVQVGTLNAEVIAKDLGAVSAINLVVLGFASAHPDFGLSLDDLQNAVRALGPAKAVETNLKALEAGAREMTNATV